MARSCTACSTSRRFNRQPTSYYTTTSGIGRLLDVAASPQGALRVGVIGLGTGTLAVYGTPGDLYQFYEINPAVVSDRQAQDFTYLARARRASRPRWATRGSRSSANRRPSSTLLAIDAFSSDAIPCT